MPVIAPRFISSNGSIHSNPLEATCDSPKIDVGGLARLFSNPSIIGEVRPSSFWKDVDLYWPKPEPLNIEIESFRNVFVGSVERLVGDHRNIAVMISGGLDSLAVLYTINQLYPDRNIFSICCNIIDDNGVSSAEHVIQQIRNLQIKCNLKIIEQNECVDWPKWNSFGPMRTGSPQAHNATVQTAKQFGCTILLSGDGSDELLFAPRYSTYELARAKGIGSARRYLKDFSYSGAGQLGELLAFLSKATSPTLRAKAYWSVSWPEWCEPSVASILRDPYRDEALAWAADWLKNSVNYHIKAKHSWSDADAYDSWWPQPFLAPIDDIEEGSPFLEEEFVKRAITLRSFEKYSENLDYPYHRTKCLVVSLFDKEVRQFLPRSKQIFRNYLSSVDKIECDYSNSIELGLFDRDALARESHPAVIKLARSTENWLAGANKLGFEIA